MSDHPADIHDGPDPEPVPEPDPAAETTMVAFIHPHLLSHVQVQKGQHAFVTSVDEERMVATITVRLADIEVPLDVIERWTR